jgi:putative nucleotidyltransferase with HDIG domain
MGTNIANILLSELLERDYDIKIKPYIGLIESIAAIISDMYRKSLSKDVIKKREEITVRRKQLMSTVITMGSMIEKRDLYTAKHQKKVAYLACKIGTKMGIQKDRFEGLYIAAMLHDIGKIGIPAEILTKPDKLTLVEFEMIKSHSQIACDILSKINFPWPVADIVLQHHERLNGSGYPFGLTGKDISLEAKILSVADVVEAITAHRPYRPALGLSYALEEIKAFSGIYYDPEVVDACIHVCTENSWDKMIDKALSDNILTNKELFYGL